MQWFRMYAEFATDPVVQSLAFEDQRHFVVVLCLKCSGLLDRKYGDRQVQIGMLRRALGLDALAFDEAKNRLQAAGLIDADWQPINWDKRQFISDRDPTAADRKRRQRERHAHVTRDTSVGHGQVTDKSRPSDTDTDTDTEKNKRARPQRARRAPEGFSPDLAYALREIPDLDAEREARKFKDWEFKTPRSDWPATWRTWIGTCRDTKRYAKRETEQWR